MIWIILAVYLGGFVAVLGTTLADDARPNSMECFALAGSWPVAWIIVLLEYGRRRAIDRSNKRYLAEEERRTRSGQRPSPEGER